MLTVKLPLVTMLLMTRFAFPVLLMVTGTGELALLVPASAVPTFSGEGEICRSVNGMSVLIPTPCSGITRVSAGEAVTMVTVPWRGPAAFGVKDNCIEQPCTGKLDPQPLVRANSAGEMVIELTATGWPVVFDRVRDREEPVVPTI